MATYQMLWDCPQCGTEKLLGLDHRFCPSCGSPQDPEARYFPSDEDKILVENHWFEGADRKCPSCDTANAAAATYCVACGAPMDGSKEVVRRGEQAAGADDSARAARTEHREARKEAEAARVAAMSGQEEAGGGKSGAGRAGLLLGLGAVPLLGGAVALLLVGVFALLCCAGALWTEETTLVVTGHSWERSVDVEALKTVTEQAWKEDVPRGAKNVSCHTEKRGTKQVPDGQTCKTVRVDNGDGTFSEKEKCTPRTRTEATTGERCSYKIDKWVTVRTDRASGRSVKDTPTWPKSTARGQERQGSKHEQYRVDFKDEGGKARSCDLSESRWKTLAVGSKWKAEVGKLAGDLRCDSLEAVR